MYSLFITSTDEELITWVKKAINELPDQYQTDFEIREDSDYSPEGQVLEPEECNIHIGYLILNEDQSIARVCTEGVSKFEALFGVTTAIKLIETKRTS